MTDLPAPETTAGEGGLAPWMDWVGLWALVAMWGSAFAAVKIAVATLEPTWLVVLRMGVAATTLAAWLAIARTPLPPMRGPGARVWAVYGLIGAVGMALPFNLFAWSAPHLDSALLGIINGASPVFTAMIAALTLADQRLTGERALGVGFGFLGLALLAGPAAFGAFGESGGWALAAAAAGAFCYSISNVATRGAPAADPVVGAFVMCSASTVASGLAAVLSAAPPRAVAPEALISAVALGVFPTGLATAIYVFLVRRRGPMFVAYTMYLAPIWAMAIGVVLLGERPGPTAFAALALILAGVYVGHRERKGHA